MSQGGWGGGGDGGGQPPGGYGPPGGGPPGGGGGYGPPPGAPPFGPPPGAPPFGPPGGAPPGYGPPPGVPPGYGPPGGPPGYGPPGYGGPPAGNDGISRLMVHALIGGAIGGVLSAIPLLSTLNCCFCLLNHVGVGAGLALYLKANPNDRVSAEEAAGAGAISGVVAGFVAGVVGMVMSLMIGSLLSPVYRSFPRELRQMLTLRSMGGGVVGIPVNMVIYAAFGALGGFVLMQLVFKDRMKS